MNRRGFLGLIAGTAGATAAGLAIPELWTPKRTFFLPPRGGWHPHAWPYTYSWRWIRGDVVSTDGNVIVVREAEGRGLLELIAKDVDGKVVACAPCGVEVVRAPREIITVSGKRGVALTVDRAA